jgi:hypothetical protein
VDDPFPGRGGGVDLSHCQVSGCLDGGALGAGAAVLGQAQAHRSRRAFPGLTQLAEVAVGAGGVALPGKVPGAECMTSSRITAMGKVFGQVTGARAEGLLPGPCLPRGAHLVGGGAKLNALSSFEPVMTGGQGAAGAQRGVGAFPRVAGNVLAAGFDVGDGAAAVPGERGVPCLRAARGAAVGGEFRG